MKKYLLLSLIAIMGLSCLFLQREPFSHAVHKPKQVKAVADIPGNKAEGEVLDVRVARIIQAGPWVESKSEVHASINIKPQEVIAQPPLQVLQEINRERLTRKTEVRDSITYAGIPEVIRAKDAYQPSNNPHSFSFFNRIHGMQHDDISSVIQDKRGNLWMGTYGGGAIRYDGLNFYHYTAMEGLDDNHIVNIFGDSKGNIWMGTRSHGAVMFDGVNFYHYTLANGLSSNRVEVVFEDSKGRIWLGHYAGVSLYDGNDVINFTEQDGMSEAVVYAIIEDEKGDMWFGTRGEGVIRFDGKHFYQYTTTQGLASDYIVGLIQDRDGIYWFATDGDGICSFDGNSFYHYNESNGFPDNYTTSIMQDRLGNIWVGTRASGLVKIADDQLFHFDLNEGLINNFITTITEDMNGKLWFGSYGGGLAQYNGVTFNHYDERQGLKDGFVRSIYQDQNDYLWFGTNREGVFRYDGSSFFNLSTSQGLSYQRVGGILEDDQGKFWFATTGGGLSVFDGSEFTHYDESSGFIDDFVIHSFKDSQGNLWFATRNSGVVMYDGSQFVNYREVHGLSADNARVISEDSSGNIWIGTGSEGISVYDGSSFYYFNEAGGLPSNNILDLKPDSKGNMWIATNGNGVARYDGSDFMIFTEREGLGSDVVYSVLEDRQGNMWFGTRMGFSRLLAMPESIQSTRNGVYTVYIKNYTQDDGFIGIGSNSRSILEDNSGRIWIGANDLLTVYNPSGDLPDTIAPGIQLTSVGLFHEPINWSALQNNPDTTLFLGNGVEVIDAHFDNLSVLYGLPENLSLSHHNNYISFSFVGVTTSFIKKLRYQYMLEGWENTWSAPAARSEVSYGNLSPGNYKFRVRAINSEGFVSDDFQFSFRVRPPWYASTVAFVLYLLIALAVVLLLFRRRSYIKQEKQKKKQRELQLKQEVEIAQKSAKFKQTFLANMSHELRTPLTGILGMASMLKRVSLDDDAREYVEALNQAGENLRETVNMILDISKIEAGKLELKESVFSLSDVFNHSIKLFEPLCTTGVELKSEIDPALPGFLIADQIRISQIIKNFLSNAVKFTREGTITLTAATEEYKASKSGNDKQVLTVRVGVCDTGMGISEQDQQKLFTPFYQTGKQAFQNVEGTGLGLAICKELATLLGGRIGVISNPGKGSCFWFTFKALTSDDKSDKQNRYEEEAESTRSLNILLVEDKAITQKVVTLMLNALGHTVVLAANGKEALKKYAPDTFDIILMDIQMPEMDGITATQHLRERYKQMPPVVGLSANAFKGDREKYMEQGMDEYITKPVKEHDFNLVLNKLGLL